MVKQNKAVQLTGQQIRLGNFDISQAEVELLLDEGFDTIEIRGVRFADNEPEPYLGPLEAEDKTAEAWYAAHVHMAAPKDKYGTPGTGRPAHRRGHTGRRDNHHPTRGTTGSQRFTRKEMSPDDAHLPLGQRPNRHRQARHEMDRR